MTLQARLFAIAEFQNSTLDKKRETASGMHFVRIGLEEHAQPHELPPFDEGHIHIARWLTHCYCLVVRSIIGGNGAVRGVVLVQQFSVFAVVLLLWAAGDAFGWFNPNVIPRLSDTGAAVMTLFQRQEMPLALWLTARDALIGVSIAAVFAIPLGLLIGNFDKVEKSTRVLLDFGRAFPAIALVPIFVLVFGTNHLTKIIMITIACFFPIIIQTIYGARRTEATMTDTVASFRIPPNLRFRKVVLPSALPFIATGIRMSLSISILVAVAAEILTQVAGLGTQVALSRTYNEVAVAFVYTIYAGLMGVVLTSLWDLIERRMLSWHHREGTL